MSAAFGTLIASGSTLAGASLNRLKEVRAAKKVEKAAKSAGNALPERMNLQYFAGDAVEGTVPDFYVGPNGKALPSQYKDWIGTNMRKELLNQAENPQLQNAIKQLYREKSFIGNGGTADVIRFERHDVR